MPQPSGPADVTINCQTGQVTARPLSPSEVAQRNADAQQALAAQQAHDQKIQAAVARVQAKAAQDPDFAALAQATGVLPLT